MNISSNYSMFCVNKNNYVKSQTAKNNQLSFKSFNLEKARSIEADLARKGVKCFFRGDSFVGECTQKVVNLFENLFGREALPSKVVFEEFSSYARNAYGAYNNIEDKVSINCNHSFFQNMQSLKAKAQSMKGEYSTSHPAHVYVHEFAHAAHWHHLENTLGFDKAYDIWKGFCGKTIPTALGKLLSQTKYGTYSIKYRDMCEFVAERAASDICKGLTSDSWKECSEPDIRYSNIFDRRKSSASFGHFYNPSYYDDINSPQAFLDRFMQHAWNGDTFEIDFANNKAGELMENINWFRYIKNRLF